MSCCVLTFLLYIAALCVCVCVRGVRTDHLAGNSKMLCGAGGCVRAFWPLLVHVSAPFLFLFPLQPFLQGAGAAGDLTTPYNMWWLTIAVACGWDWLVVQWIKGLASWLLHHCSQPHGYDPHHVSGFPATPRRIPLSP